jgi:hypothetical protein
MKWTIVTFGRHQGKSLPQILVCDPDWFFWMLPKLYGSLGDEAQDLARKATAIKIPGPNAERQVVEYRHEEGRPPGSGGFLFVNADRPVVDRWGTRRPNLNLSFVCRNSSYDKKGCRRLIRDFRHRYFGPNVRLTKERVEEFFSNEDNFVRGKSHRKAG